MKSAVARGIRQSIGFTHVEFATLLGVAPATVYRWDQAADQNIDPFQASVLMALRELVKGLSESDLVRFKKEMKSSIAVHGGLRTLYVLLSWVFDQEGK